MTGQMKNKQKLTELVIKAQAGDQDALNDLIGACYEDLYYFAYQTVKDPDTASDIIQDSCIKIITNLDKLQSPEAFSVWARNITYNHCAMHFRKTKEVQPLETEDGESILDSLPDESEGSLPEQVVEDKEFQKTMQDMLDSLPGEQRSAMMLYYYEKLSVKQIAEVFETSEGTIKSRLNYGRKAMKGKVEEYEKKNGVRLHSSLLPLLLLWLFQKKKKSIPKAAVPILAGVSTAAAASAGVAATISGGLVIKIVAGVVAAVVAVSAVVGGVKLFDGKNDQDPTHLNGSTPTSNSTQTTEKQEGTVPTAPNQSDDDPSGDGENITPPVQEPDSPETPDVDNPSGDGGENVTPPVQEPDQGEDTPETPDSNDPSGGDDAVTPPVQEPDQGEGSTDTPDVDGPAGDDENASQGLEFVKVDGGYAVAGIGTCTDEVVTIPATYMGEPVISIQERAFSDCTTMKHVVVPDSISDITAAFYGCTSLRQITLPAGILAWTYAFVGCTSLTEVIVPDGIPDLSSGIASCPALERITISGRVEKLEGFFAKKESLISVTLLEGFTNLNRAFWGCTSLTSVTIPISVRAMLKAFQGCSALTDIYYAGTMEQWTAISGSTGSGIRAGCVIHCSDGDIIKNTT